MRSKFFYRVLQIAVFYVEYFSQEELNQGELADHRLQRGPAERRWVAQDNMFYVYILKSLKTDKYYIGSTDNLIKRLKRHNTGKNRYTRSGVPWVLIHQESFTTRQGAYKREMQIKKYKNGEAFKKLIHN